MNIKMVLNTVGQLLRVEAMLMLLPLAVSFYYNENTSAVYGIVMALLLIVSTIFTLPKLTSKRIYAREGFIIVALSWVFISFFGALPFVLSGAIPSMVDAFFETVSGFTTTGATILSEIESLPKSILFWRSFTHWIGGMGVLVFVLAFLPQKDTQAMHIMRAEVPGPTVGKLVSKTQVTARILYLIYTVMTIILIILLIAFDMPVFDSVTNAFSAAGTGGFCSKNTSIAYYDNVACEIILSVFMLLFGVNFNIFYLLLIKQFKRAFKSEELWVYFGIVSASILIIALNIMGDVGSFATALRQSGFTVSSVITTTGFITADFSTWPTLSQFILVLLMMIGACAGSTGGGLKVGRIIILFKTCFRELRHALNPRRVKCIKLDGAVLDKDSVKATSTYFMLYMFVIAFSCFAVSLDKFEMTAVVTSVISCFNNVGPALSNIALIEHFADFSVLSKLVLTADMLLGRLEIIPILLLFTPSTWKKSV